MTMNATGYPILDEDDMSSDSATSLATQQSIKAYVDAQVASAGLDWVEETGTTHAMVSGQGVIANNAGTVTCTLPATAAVGDIFAIIGEGAGGWSLAQNASQTVHFNGVDNTTGATGSWDSTNQYNSIWVVCTATNTDFVVLMASGSLSYS